MEIPVSLQIYQLITKVIFFTEDKKAGSVEKRKKIQIKVLGLFINQVQILGDTQEEENINLNYSKGSKKMNRKF